MLTVHMIANAHLDPVWLWHWQRGADEALATCRSACEILDDYPEVVFTRGEAWVYEQVRTLDPALFERIRGHIQAGRWVVVNGWWVQADTNLPTEEALLATARLGQAWFREHLGLPNVPVAYLVDSFGHGAFLPRIMRQSGQNRLVMMRPQPHELTLPSCLFRWRSPDGHEVVTFRIIEGYVCNGPDSGLENRVRAVIAAPRPEGVEHVMCFYGVGDHGGGPTRQAVEWIRAHRDFAPGVRLEFSSPPRFFDAVEKDIERLPIVTGELQMHAVGCYSVCGGLKRELRAAEQAAADGERLLARCPAAPEGDLRGELTSAWRTICFNQFHDILPGSSVPDAIEAARRQVGAAREQAERAIYVLLRRYSGIAEREVRGHRLHFVNRTSLPVSGLGDMEVWFDWQAWRHHLETTDGQILPLQPIPAVSLMYEGAGTNQIPRLLFPLALAPGEALTLRVVEGEVTTPATPGDPFFQDGILRNGRMAVHFGARGIEQVMRDGVPLLGRPLQLLAIGDASDTWAHGYAFVRFDGPVLATAQFGPPEFVVQGPLRVTVRLDGQIGSSAVRLYVSLDRNATRVDARIETLYREAFTVLKASVAPAFEAQTRRDRVGGGWLDREMDGCERPVHHAVTLRGSRRALSVLFPDSFAADVPYTGCIRVTLLRNNVHAYSSYVRLPEEEIPELRARFGTDEGPAVLRLSLLAEEEAGEETVESALAMLQRPPWAWDDFRGVSRVDAHPIK
jgi:alpha-mannosidase